MAVPAPSNLAPRVIRFGVFEADFRAGELRKSGARIKLEGQPFQILALLLERPGDVVTREELQQKLWPAETFVDFEHSINTAVKRLREALGDSADSPRFIETLPRRGYRFIYPLNGGVAPIPARSAWWRVYWRVAVVSALLLAFLGALLMLNVAGLRHRLLGTRDDAPVRSLAVLPLENLTGDAEQEYFVDGIHDELITQLAQINSLEVTSRTSVLRYKQQKRPLPEIARELNVDGVLEGAVRRSGDRIHLTLQLISARSDRHLWAQSYDRDPRDIANLPGEVARTIANRLKISLTPEEQARLSKAKPVDPEVYKAYLKGKHHAEKWTNESLWQAIRHFQEAQNLDPTYAPAWAGMGAAYEFLGGFARGANLSREDAVRRAKAALDRAVELDPALRGPHQALGRMKLAEWDWEGATREFQLARELDPGFAPSRYLLSAGRFDEAVAAQSREARLDPLGYSGQLVLGLTYFMAGRYDESIAQLKNVVNLDPSIHHAHYELAWNYAKKGMHKEAIAECEASLVLLRKQQAEAFVAPSCGWVYAMAGRRREALEIARKLEQESVGDVRTIQLAHIYDALGDHNRALTFLSTAYEKRAPELPSQWFDPRYSDRLRADPRFQELIRRTGIPWASFTPREQSQAGASNPRADPRRQ